MFLNFSLSSVRLHSIFFLRYHSVQIRMKSWNELLTLLHGLWWPTSSCFLRASRGKKKSFFASFFHITHEFSFLCIVFCCTGIPSQFSDLINKYFLWLKEAVEHLLKAFLSSSYASTLILAVLFIVVRSSSYSFLLFSLALCFFTLFFLSREHIMDNGMNRWKNWRKRLETGFFSLSSRGDSKDIQTRREMGGEKGGRRRWRMTTTMMVCRVREREGTVEEVSRICTSYGSSSSGWVSELVSTWEQRIAVMVQTRKLNSEFFIFESSPDPFEVRRVAKNAFQPSFTTRGNEKILFLLFIHFHSYVHENKQRMCMKHINECLPMMVSLAALVFFLARVEINVVKLIRVWKQQDTRDTEW